MSGRGETLDSLSLLTAPPHSSREAPWMLTGIIITSEGAIFPEMMLIIR